MLTLRQIEVVRAVMVTGSLARAARLLNVSAPGISRLMKYTEQSLGVRLFDRRGGRLVPSERGRDIFDQINVVFSKIEDLRFVIDNVKTGVAQELRIGAAPSISQVMVPLAIERLRARFPQLVIDVNMLKIEEAVDYLLLGKGEVVAMSSRFDHPGLNCEPLANGRFVRPQSPLPSTVSRSSLPKRSPSSAAQRPGRAGGCGRHGIPSPSEPESSRMWKRHEPTSATCSAITSTNPEWMRFSKLHPTWLPSSRRRRHFNSKTAIVSATPMVTFPAPGPEDVRLS